jgi:hypothetical protein
VAAHQLAHRGIALDAAQQHVFFVGQHHRSWAVGIQRQKKLADKYLVI